MKVLLFLPKGFEHMETGVFIDVMGWARTRFGCDIDVETAGFSREVRSTFDVPIVVDKLIDEIDADDYDAMALPGGFWDFGFFEEAHDEKFLELIRSFDAKGKIIASVCVAALALGKSGILKGRKATTYHLGGGKRQAELRAYGADVVNESVVVDRNVITSYCPETAVRVAFELLERLTSPEKTAEVKTAMGY
ncbi:DJ-1/PfpI family protein [Synergistaceae bacterium OttesenSCG-928-I11]|nr:DJ-1/PfpI family protein [Synergistaceae bacterium OttesenSCG-928-I11]